MWVEASDLNLLLERAPKKENSSERFIFHDQISACASTTSAYEGSMKIKMREGTVTDFQYIDGSIDSCAHQDPGALQHIAQSK